MKSPNILLILSIGLWLSAGGALFAQSLNLEAGRQRTRLQQASLHTTTYKDQGGYFQIHLVEQRQGDLAGFEIVLEGPATGAQTIAKADAHGIVWQAQVETPAFWKHFARANGVSGSIQAVTGDEAGAPVAELKVVGSLTHRLRFSGLSATLPAGGAASEGSWLDVQIEESTTTAPRGRLYSQRTDLAQLAAQVGANRTLVDLERNMVSNYFQAGSH